jgi:hypothetical protein
MSPQKKTRSSKLQTPTVYQCAVPVERIMTEIEALHLMLDGFASGKTRELKGQRVRDVLRSSLTDIDTELKGLDQLLSKKSSNRAGVSGVARTEAAQLAQKLDEYLEVVVKALRPYMSGEKNEPLSAATRNTSTLFWREVKQIVKKLHEILGNEVE